MVDVTVENFDEVLEELRRILPYCEFCSVSATTPFLGPDTARCCDWMNAGPPIRARDMLPAGHCVCYLSCQPVMNVGKWYLLSTENVHCSPGAHRWTASSRGVMWARETTPQRTSPHPGAAHAAGPRGM